MPVLRVKHFFKLLYKEKYNSLLYCEAKYILYHYYRQLLKRYIQQKLL